MSTLERVHRSLRPLWMPWFEAVIQAWWDSWVDAFADIGKEVWQRWIPRTTEEYIRKHQLENEYRSLLHDHLDADMIVEGGGNFEGSGTGGND